MASFFAFTLKIMNIEPFDPDFTDGYEDYERPGGYATKDGQKIQSDPSRLKLVTIMISPGILARCPIDVETMGFKEDQEVKVIMSGRKVACVANAENQTYVYFNEAIRKRFNSPRVVMGVNMAIVSLVGGYILALIFRQLESRIGLIAVEGGMFFLFVASVIYAIYYYTNDSEAFEKLGQFMKKLLK
jgi:hypothetical protein